MPQISDLIPSIPLNDGSVIPQLGFGTLSVPPDRESTPANAEITAEVVGLALQAGYRHIDTAQAYGNEAGVGRAIAVSGVPRRELYVTSKLSNSNHRLADVRRSFHKTLEDLGRDQLDLFLIHWPLPTLYDGDYVSTWRAVTEFVAEGTLRTAGVSNFQPAHLDRIVAETVIVPAVNQVELHPYFVNGAVRAAAERHGIAIEAHSPSVTTARPFLTRPSPASPPATASPPRRSSFAGTFSMATSLSRSHHVPSGCATTSTCSTSS